MPGSLQISVINTEFQFYAIITQQLDHEKHLFVQKLQSRWWNYLCNKLLIILMIYTIISQYNKS